MIIIALSDVHGDISRLPALSGELANADVVLLTGDLTHFGGQEDAERVVQAVRQHNGRILAVAGNCDHPEVDQYLDRERLNLHGASAVVDGITFAGVGGSLPGPVACPNEYSEEQTRDFLQRAGDGLSADAPLVLVSHNPPWGTAVDVVGSGQRAGSRSVRAFIEQRRPLLCCTGHIHEAAGTDQVGPTRIVNPGPFRDGWYGYALVRDGIADQVEIRGI